MEWSLLLAIVGVAALLQLVFFWYYLRLGQGNSQLGSPMSGDQTSSAQASNEADHRGGADPHRDELLLTCQECGHENEWDPVFTYCESCLTKIA